MADTYSLMAVFSDVHSNLEALEAVLADMETRGARRFFCLGDIVGYGADPDACLERVRALGCPVIKGNHDAAAAIDKDNKRMNTPAQAGIDFSRKRLSPEQRKWLGNLPLALTEDDYEFVHGSMDAPEDWWYVLSPEEALLHFAAQKRPVCFCGHTHDPMLWHWDGMGKLTIRHGEGRIVLPFDGKALINVGSVGQPRDLNPNACYALFNPLERWVEFRRVPYNISKAKRKITRAGLPLFSSQRLSLGR